MGSVRAARRAGPAAAINATKTKQDGSRRDGARVARGDLE